MGRGCDPPSERPARWHPEGCPCIDTSTRPAPACHPRATRGPAENQVSATAGSPPPARQGRPSMGTAGRGRQAQSGGDHKPANPPHARGTRGRRSLLSSCANGGRNVPAIPQRSPLSHATADLRANGRSTFRRPNIARPDARTKSGGPRRTSARPVRAGLEEIRPYRHVGEGRYPG